MKKFLGILLVLCVVAPASFSAQLDEYTWTGTTGNFTDSTWSCNFTGQPAIPFESANTTDWVAYARPAISTTGTVTVNTDLAPTNLGFQQFQLKRGNLVVDNGGELRIHTGYLHVSTTSTASTNQGTLIVQNGGQYINTATSTGNQSGTLLTYTTASSKGFVTVTGAGSLFDSLYVYGGRHGQTQVRAAEFGVEGSGSTINVGTMGPGGNNMTMTYRFSNDAAGVSAINIATLLAFRQGVTLTHVNNVSILDFIVAAPVTEGQVFTLFNLGETATKTGWLQDRAGRMLYENAWYGARDALGNTYGFVINYLGGTGNDITLTAVPEPATLGLLGLGGLVLARRRRA